ncbi:MAG: trigger factor [Firmicutes bacterium]|jgi:trigger factor|nr:trigger factor [Bacillota bacterium]
MKATFISREKNDVKFTMEFTAEEFDQAQVKVYQAQKGKIEIPGFRKGKAPRSIIEKHFGEGIFFEDAIDELLRGNYEAAVKELDLDLIDSPRAEFSELKKGEGFTVTITVAVAPVVEVKNYKGIEIEKIENEVKDEDVENNLKQQQERNARIVSVERAAQEGDTLVLDYAGFVGEEQFEGGTALEQELTLGSQMFIPGFEEQLVGVAAGEDKDVVVTFPEEYHAPDLAGKEAVFKCHVHQVKEKQVPALDDEFAADLGFDTLDELKASEREKLEKYAKAGAENQMKDAVLGKLVEATEVEIPEVMIKDELDRSVQELNQQLSYQGLSIKQYLEFTGKAMGDFLDELRPEAEKAVKTRLVIAGVAAAEAIEVSEEEVEEELKVMAVQYQMTADKVRELLGEDMMQYLVKDLKSKKAIEVLFENAVIK